MRKGSFFLILMALVVVGFFSQGFLISSFFHWYLKGYCSNCLDGQLVYEKMYHDGEAWRIEKPAFYSLSSLEKGDYHFLADSATIQANIKWLQRQIDLNITLVEPEINVGKGADTLKHLISSSSAQSNLFSVNTQLNVIKGSLNLRDLDSSGSINENLLHFSLHLSCQSTKEGCATFWYDDENVNHLKLNFSENDSSSLQVAFHAKEMNCADFIAVLKQIIPDLKQLEISQGTVNGNGILNVCPGSSTDYSGTLTIKDLEFGHPIYELKGHVPELSIALTPILPKAAFSGIKNIGQFEISKNATLEFYKKGFPYWQITELNGVLDVGDQGKKELKLDACCVHNGELRKLKISGNASLSNDNKKTIYIDAILDNDKNDKETSFAINFAQIDSQQKSVLAQLKNVSKEEFDFIQNICGRINPFWNQLKFNQGFIDASLNLNLHGLNISKVQIKDIDARQISMYLEPWKIAVGIDQAKGTCSFDLSVNDVWETINSDMSIAGGYMSLPGVQQARWRFSDIHTKLAIRKGDVQKTTVKAVALGLKGEIEIDGDNKNEIARLNFKGLTTGISETLPVEFKDRFKDKFLNDELQISATVSKDYNGASVVGKIFLNEIGSPLSNETVDFGFLFEKPTFAIKDGWFNGNHLPLEKYISPFLFLQDQMKLYGEGEFEGKFDEKQIIAHFDAKDLVLENSDFSINLKSLSDENDTFVQSNGNFVFDFETNCCISRFPVINATYFEKNSGLLFTDVNGTAVLKNDCAKLSNVEAFCNGIYFKGTIDLDWSMPGEGVFEAIIQSDQMFGKVSQVQNLLSHFDNSIFFLKLPIEGNVEFRSKGGKLHFSFSPNDYVLDAKIFATMMDGALLNQIGALSAQELSLDVFYDHLNNKLEFTDIQGTLLVGSPNHLDEYDLLGEHIRFTDYVNNEAEFNLWVSDKGRDVLRFAGSTKSKESSPNHVDFNFDRTLSHIGEVHPSTFELTLKEWSDVEHFKFDLSFDLKNSLKDLQRLSRGGSFLVSKSILKEINDIDEAKGNFNVKLDYDGHDGVFNYKIVGLNTAIGPYSTDEFLLNGKKQGSKWSIDQFQFDKICLAADLLKNDHIWKVNFLGARIGKSLLLGMDGHYNDELSLLEAKINLLEADLAYLNDWPGLKGVFEDYQLAGQMHGNGLMYIQIDKTLPQKMRTDVSLNCSLRNGKWRGLYFQDFENAILNYSSDKGLNISHVDTALVSAKDGSVQANVFLQSLNNDFANNELLFDSFVFKIPSKNLAWLSENLQQSLPDVVSPELSDIIKNLKSEGDLLGQLKFEFSQPHSALQLILEDGIYNFMQREHDLSHFVLEYDPFELKISTKYQLERHQFWLTARSPAPAINKGEMILSEKILDLYDEPGTFPLTINWEIDPAHGLFLHKIEGALCGIKCNLVRDPSFPVAGEQIYLEGDIQVNLQKAQALANPEIAAICSNWELGHGYCLSGKWALTKDNKPFQESLTFQGELTGRDFELGGYQFFHMMGQVGYTGNALRAANISITDPSANVHIKEIMLSKGLDNNWTVDMPLVSMNNFRPSLLHVKGEAPPRIAKALNVRQFDLFNFHGILGERSSYTGKGRFSFVNPPKRNLQHTIFALPAELMSRLGLDFGVLNPVRGNIFYDIMDAKIVFTRFKDVYSKGRLSKFYLSDPWDPSYMDFDGNLNLQIRMRQYNLFFKLAELFTVTVNGTIKKPSYSLQKQVKTVRYRQL